MDNNTKEVLLFGLPLLVTLVNTVVTAWVAVQLALIRGNVARVERNTNGQGEQLRAIAHAAGVVEGQAQEREMRG